MANPQLHWFVRRLRHTLGPESGGMTDGQLLERFVSSRDEPAFEVLMWRHGPMVLGVCTRLLANEQDAEDVFQATFLTLARKAGSIGKRESLGGWLYTTACRAALRARLRGTHQARVQGLPGDVPAPEAADNSSCDLRPLLDEEIARLPLKYRLPVLFVYLQGKTTAEVALQLGCPRGTVCSRLSWARDRLRSRLLRRGFTYSGPALVTALYYGSAKAVPPGLVQATLKGALAFATGQVTAEVISTQAAIIAEGVLKAMFLTKLKVIAGVLLTVSVLTLGAGLWTQRVQADKESPDAVPELVAGDANAIRVPADMVVPFGIQAAEVQRRAAKPPRILSLAGSLALDPERLVRVRSLVQGEVVAIGQVEEKGEAGDRLVRPIRAGAQVRKGQLLAVVWSKEVGEKKGELVDALLRLRQDRAILAKVEEAYKQGNIPEVTFLQTQRNVQADQNTIARVERTLRIWRLSETEIKAVRDEADRIIGRQGKRHEETEKNWARVEIHAPLDGTIVEKNFAVGEVLTDQTIDLVKIANLDRLIVVVNVAEADLAALLAQLSGSRKWTVQPVGGPPIAAEMDEIGYLIDPNQHTANVKGYIDNPGHKLRAGQFITVSIVLPVPVREMTVPAGAVVDEDKASYVFVQPDPKQFVYRQRRVLVVRRGQDVVHIRSPLTSEEERQGFQSLRAGERILTGGVVELKATLDDLKTKAKP
jgi:membrane fusion protein, heavy metal efflux system